LAARPFAVRPFPADPLAFFFFWAERGRVPCPGFPLVPRRAGDLVVVLLLVLLLLVLLARLPDPAPVPGERRRVPSSGFSSSRASSA